MIPNIVFAPYDLKVDTESQFCYGIYKEFHIFVVLNENNEFSTIVIYARWNHEQSKCLLQSFLKAYCEKDAKMKGFTYEDYKLTVSFLLNCFDSMSLFIETCVNFLKEQKFVACCDYCLGENDLADYKLNKMPVTLCSQCYDTINFENDQRNKLLQKGIKGAFIGSLIALFLWVIVYHFGYIYLNIPKLVISAIGGFVTTIFTMKGYEKLTISRNKTDITYCNIIMIIMVFVSLYSAMAVELYIEFNIIDSMEFLESFSAVSRILDFDNGKRFVTNIFVAYSAMLFTESFLLKNFSSTYFFHNEISKLD